MDGQTRQRAAFSSNWEAGPSTSDVPALPFAPHPRESPHGSRPLECAWPRCPGEAHVVAWDSRWGLDVKAVVLEPRMGSLSPGGHGVITPLLGVSKAFGP